MQDKAHTTFESYYDQLKHYLEENKKFPGKDDDYKLYHWQVRMRIEKKNKALSEDNINMLNNLGFIWNIHEYKWQEKLDEVKNLLLQNIIPNNISHPYLYYWMNKHLFLERHNQLPAKKAELVQELSVLINKAKENTLVKPDEAAKGKQKRWNIKYEQLLQFRKQNPDRWPKANTIDEEERKLAVWCISLRNFYNKGVLLQSWYEKLVAISFNFSKRANKWMEQFENLKNYLAEHQSLPNSYHKLYQWTVTQHNKFSLLNDTKQRLLNGIEFKKYFTPAPVNNVLKMDTWYGNMQEIMQEQKHLSAY